MGSKIRVSRVVFIRLFIIIVVSGCCMLLFRLWVMVVGIRLSVVIVVVMSIGCMCLSVVLMMVLCNGRLDWVI